LGWALAAQGLREDAIAAWQRGGISEREFIALGEDCRKIKQFESALVYYQWAIEMAPQQGDPWYYVGLAYQDARDWESAVAAFDTAASRPGGNRNLGSTYYHLGFLYHYRLKNNERAGEYFELALGLEQTLPWKERQWLHYYRARMFEESGEIALARQSYETALGTPSSGIPPIRIRTVAHYEANVRLGLLYWRNERNLQKAEQFLLKAVGIRPDLRWAYWELAEIYREVGDMANTAEMYQNVLMLNPDDEEAKEALKSLE